MFWELFYLHTVIAMLFLTIHKYIEKKDLDLKQLIFGVFFSISLLTSCAFYVIPEFFDDKINTLIYLIIWVLPCVSFVHHWKSKN